VHFGEFCFPAIHKKNSGVNLQLVMQPAVERCPSVVEESHASESSGEDDGTRDITSPSPRKRKRDENTTPS